MYNHESTECQDLANKVLVDISQEDLKYIHIPQNGTETVGRHYQVVIQFRKDETNLSIFHKQRRDLPA